MKQMLSALLILVAMTSLAAAKENPESKGTGLDEEITGPELAVDEEALVIPTRALVKPETFGSWSERLDFIHYNTHFHMQGTVDRVDTYFAKGGAESVKTPPSKLRLGMYFEFEVDSGLNVGIDPDYDMEVQLPNLEQRWHIIISGKDVGDLPGTDPTERESGASVGIQKGLDKLNIKFGGGVRVKFPPELFGEAKWVPVWSAGSWVFRPQIKGYWKSDEGFGNINSFVFYSWFGKRQRGIFRSTSAGRWTEETEGVEWEQTFALGYVPALLQRKTRRQNVSSHDTARLIGLRYSTFGHKSGEAIVDRYRATIAFRFPLYKNYIYGELMPEIEWRDENDWDPVERIRLGVDMLFWGVGPS